MKKIDINLIKDFIISILIVISIVLILTIILYNKTGITKIIPETQEYSMSEEMEEDLSETAVEEENTIITYKIDSTDLNAVEKTKEYDKGKQNPFATSSEGIDNNTITNDTQQGGVSSSENQTFYEDDGMK